MKTKMTAAAYSVVVVVAGVMLHSSLASSFVLPLLWCGKSRFHLRSKACVQSKRTDKLHDTVVVEDYPDFLPNPHPSLDPPSVVTACMDTLQSHKVAGLEVCFHFSNDRCRAAMGGNLEHFQAYAKNPVFGYLVHCQSYQIVNVGALIPGTLHRGSLQTILVAAESDEKESRTFLWTLQQERRPPYQDCWMVHEVLYTKNAFQQTL